MATPTKADIEKARKHFWDSAPSRTPEEAIEKLAQFRADAVADEREKWWKAGQEAMRTQAERWYQKLKHLSEAERIRGSYNVSPKDLTLEPVPGTTDYVVPSPSEGKV